MRVASYGCWPIVPSSLPSCLPQLRSHTGAPSRPSRREFAQTNNCSDRRALVCYMAALPLPEKADRQSGRQVDRRVNRRRVRRRERSRRLGPAHSGPSAYPGKACVLYVSQQGRTVRHVTGPSRHKQMFSGYCCSASLVIVFLQGQPVGQGARLCCGKELWRDGKTECIINQWLWRLLYTDGPSFFLVLHVA